MKTFTQYSLFYLFLFIAGFVLTRLAISAEPLPPNDLDAVPSLTTKE